MSSCCESSTLMSVKKKAYCPKCSEEQNLTSYKTVLHQLRNPYAKDLNEQGTYYFCRNQNCDAVYFDVEQNVYSMEDVRHEIGQKMTSPSRKICYCFDVTYEQVADEFSKYGESRIKEFVKAQTKAKNCACEIRNPAGKCCLADFPKS